MYRRLEPYRFGLGEHWRRQIGDVSPTAFTRRIGGCEDLVRRLVKYAELDGHSGCVNTVSFNPTGELLVSGSDDQDIIVWNWANKTQVLSYISGHENNVFQARVMPYCDDRIIVSCAADGQVRSATILENGMVVTKKLAKHRGRAHKMAIEPGSSRIFYSCGEDGVVQHFDLREEKATKLLTCHQFGKNSGKPSRSRVVRLNVIVTHPINLNYFTVGGSDQYARVYDIRRLTANGSEMEDQPVETYAPKHLLGPGHDEHITCVAYSHQEELLVSYNDELIYLFDKSMSLGSSPHKNVEENEKEGDGGEASNQGNTQPQVYEGHRNHQTVKGVNFFGPNTEYVVSGSDCGRIFIWKKKGGKLVALMKGDDTVVNCLEPHPYATILATSGIEDTIKIWSPESERILDLPHDTDRIMRINKRRRESQANNIQLTPGLVRRLLLSRHLHMPNYNEGGTNTQVSFEGGYADDDGGVVDSDFDEDDSFEEGDIGNPRECIIS
ncbi:uncharacterized protein [Physcomitrium patens]|uniref:Uncharacterized protein n=1 Tax=Physcomitrium patens TaxID=3218 RepID=A9S530_PHYPA|nr:DDB1- and CUL4-associated factor 8-like isoform X1 [Physcomitrium patens]XP_024395121.1 DDB1- and CUL4-associated factor 8-like isoform X1 [Physcomitrium patens]XP_024395122.1 DDB1- and CUL4-associated factor 8-like isoform X1 [Physcomitrium patens]PNR41197.1 hypothetical protein PHYPA_018600 [Physcomitrium patens]|eukprot:XP_024395119.1 DDB1- and CUL4-associated factor 8-like isoform X1 [Physcomitrella patens]